MRFKIRNIGRIALLLAAGLSVSLAFGQNANTGEIRGTVQDSTGAVLEGVKVTITNVETGVSQVSTTTSAGVYDVPSVPTGSYTITFSKTGFKDLVRKGITLQIQTIGVDATLQVGSISEQVIVTEDSPLLETETSDQHVSLNAEAVSTAPIVGTDWRAEMIQLIPGANTGGGAGEINGQGVGVNGTQSYNINFLSDGGPATAPRDFNGSNYYMPVDAIGEVTINSANANVQYGSGLTSINVNTKSGTNQWHGSVYEYIQNTALNSRAYNNPTGPKSVEHWNTYGGSVGGPVMKNKLFFFFLYQRNPSVAPTSGKYSYPNAAEEQGNFFGTNGATNPAFFDPTTGQLLVPQDTVALNLQKFFPASTARGWIPGCPGPANPSASAPQTCPNTTNDFVFNGSSPNTDTWYTGKADYNINSKQRLSFSFNYFPTVSTYVPADPLFPSDATSTQKGFTDDLTSQLSELYTISPTVVNEFRIGASRELDKYSPPSLNKNDPETVGLQPTYGTNSPSNVFPKIQIDAPGGGNGSGCIALGAGCGENGNISAVLGEGSYLASDVLTLIRGKHTIKVGGEYDRFYQNYTNWGDISSGNFEFNGTVTGVPYADFLAGDVYGWYVFNSDPTSAHSWSTALFGSDDIKISSRLTLNVGLRWQAQSGWGVKKNLFGNYDPFLPNPGAGVGGPRGAILFGGQGDTIYGGPTTNMSTIQDADYKEFAPRIGIAWSPRDRWSVRASYGIFDAPRDSENYTDGALGLGFNPHQVGNNGYSNGSAVFQLDQGPTPGSGLMVVYPTLQTLTSTVSNFSGVEYYPRNMPTTYVQTFLLSLQHEFAGNMLLDTSYVYTRGRNLNFQTNINQAPISEFGCTTYNCGNPNPIFNDIQAQIYDGYSNYNALQLRLQKRMSYGLSLQVNYAWSKWLDTGTGGGHGSGIDIYQNAFNPTANYGLSDGNATNTLVGQIVYELPFGRARQYALRGPLDQVAGGWRVSTLFQWHSGTPFTPVIQSGIATTIDPGLSASINQGGSTLYPDVVGSSSVSHRTNANWFNPAAFANPAPGTFGDAGRNILTGPGFTNVDFSLAKEFPIHEAISLEVRADMFDVFNHINWANPNNDVGVGTSPCPPTGPNAGLDLANCTAGTITGTEGGTRIVQLGAHIRF